MARKKIADATQHGDVNDAALGSATNSLALVHGNSVQVAELVGYELAYDRDRIIQETWFYMGTAAEAMLEAGKRLVLLKENEGHGEFTRIVEEQLGIPARTARQMMQAAIKYLADPTLAGKRQAFTVLGKAKMFELMTLDSDELVELSEGGSVVGITLDEVDRMSVRELKAALRDAQADAKAKDEVLANRAATIDRLQTKQAKLASPTHDEDVAQLRRETSDAAFHAEGVIRGTLRDGLTRLIEDEAASGTSHAEFCAGLLAQLERAAAELRSTLGIKSQPDGDPRPEWDR